MILTTRLAVELLTLADVAQLAGVRRPVVSMWRSRYADGARGPAFPPVRATIGGVDRFDRDHVIAWLQASGRGNNSRVADEAILGGTPPVATPSAYQLAEAMVIIAGLTGETLAGLDPDDVVAMAEDLDPEDRCLLSEVSMALRSELEAMAPYADAMLNSSYGALDALDRLGAQADRFGVPADRGELSDDVRRLVLALAEAIADPLNRVHGIRGCRLVDPTGCSGLLPMTHDDWPDGVVLPTCALTETSADGVRPVRGTWRRLLAGGARTHALHAEAELAADDRDNAAQRQRGDASGSAPARTAQVLVARVPYGGGSDATPAVLEAIGDLLLDLRATQPAIIVGPAGALVDDIQDSHAARARTYLLRDGLLRAALRLGAGARTGVPQAGMALWVWAGRDDIDPEYRRTATADLAGLSLDDVLDDVVADVLAAWLDRGTELRGQTPDGAQTRESRAHAFRIARYELTSVVCRRPAVVTRYARATRSRTASLNACQAVAGRVAPSLAGVAVNLTVPMEPIVAGATTTLGEAERAGRVRVLPGVRLQPGLAAANVVGPPVVGAVDLCRETAHRDRRVDLLQLTRHHPRAALTEPGDVVFTTTPFNAAWVDASGGSIVESPARILRIIDDPSGRPPRPQRLWPAVLAADLTRFEGAQWRSATLRLVPTERAAAVGALLSTAHSAREAALARVRDLALLADVLADGVVAGEVMTTIESMTDRPGPTVDPDQEGR